MGLLPTQPAAVTHWVLLSDLGLQRALSLAQLSCCSRVSISTC